MKSKPKQWSNTYASIFQDASVVSAYQHRPPYSPETFEVLASLLPPSTARLVLDAGCGTGFIARFLAPYVDHIDAIDISPGMIAMGQSLPGGNNPRITWQVSSLETASLTGPYALIVAAASLHWLDWEIVLPRFHTHLAPGAFLAIVEDQALPNPWDAQAGPILGQYSMNTDYSPYTMQTVIAELEELELFHQVGARETAPVSFRQPIAAWIESFHARNGFSRDRMPPATAAACDESLRQVITPFCPDGVVEQQIMTRIFWGTPQVRW
jgi:SAM-dependent methyltransferase